MWEDGGKDDCYVDSGGPLVNAEVTLIGLVSWGVEYAVAGNLGVLTQLGSLRDFVGIFL